MTTPNEPSSPADDLEKLKRAEGGNEQALTEVLARHRRRLKRMIAMRMNPRLQGRLDASDVIQDALVEAARTLDDYLADPALPVFLWLRHLATEKLIQAHRRHLGAQKRDAARELSIHGHLNATSEMMAIQLVGNMTSPSEAAVRNERKRWLQSALESLNPLDREVLTLKHFEHLSSREVAKVLEMNYEAVKKRYVRALDKLHLILEELKSVNQS